MSQQLTLIGTIPTGTLGLTLWELTDAGIAIYIRVQSSASGLCLRRTLLIRNDGTGGNLWQWEESALDSENDSASEIRGCRGVKTCTEANFLQIWGRWGLYYANCYPYSYSAP
jgi:hypothetical protein